MRVLVTGANGFVGQTMVRHLEAQGHYVIPATRCPSVGSLAVGEIDGNTDWSVALKGCQAVVHLAARVHVMDDKDADPLSAFRQVNVEGTVNLAVQAQAADVKRLIFVSSVKIHSEECDTPFDELMTPSPSDAYGMSKWEAEQGLARIAASGDLEYVILRPPLIYGPGVGANFLRLLNAVAHGAPLPFQSINNRRSLLFVGNLCDVIELCLEAPEAKNQTFLISDGGGVSTTQLIRELATGLAVRPRLFSLPPALIKALVSLTGKSKEWQRLSGSLEVNDKKIRQSLNWTPPFDFRQGIAQTIDWYKQDRRHS
ncbi:NAD-dependent epimerase/dehydratase family protein [Hydrogenophaga sp.]|uniref:NAD-dependent epimerase/dehydratase family protein n=1 Tax=Hydrogenophaga sp. TaxID=1904254 RepID=UPI002730D3C5|nr:NAD-dependent epimerase/dehydratase family protein [Hydrogenophaga sp.]MDP1683929.1 NAD-dependent epimerase/dehydratase family protein [Hydrogenophaga sp.]